ncbi:MAG: RNA 2',3'-cyclic phosphodiesterase [[Clostridium] leptum]
MRLFLAILFEEPVKDRLREAMELIRRSTRTSRLTRRENLHLTLVFLGELREAGKVREAMEEIRTGPFPLEIRGLGRFQRDGGDLYWAGIEPSLPLQTLPGAENALAGKGIAVEDRPYRPHLTLARQAVEKPEIPFYTLKNRLEPVKAKAAAVSLMKSERIEGRLVYTELYRKELRENKGKEAML